MTTGGMTALILIRGLPGSGKSTLARQFIGHQHFEADMYFECDGVYTFDATKLKDAHEWCQSKTRQALYRGQNVVVANTFTRRYELQPYIDMAQELGATVQIITETGTWANVHNVPAEVIERMKQRWETV